MKTRLKSQAGSSCTLCIVEWSIQQEPNVEKGCHLCRTLQQLLFRSKGCDGSKLSWIDPIPAIGSAQFHQILFRRELGHQYVNKPRAVCTGERDPSVRHYTHMAGSEEKCHAISCVEIFSNFIMYEEDSEESLRENPRSRDVQRKEMSRVQHNCPIITMYFLSSTRFRTIMDVYLNNLHAEAHRATATRKQDN